MPVLGMLIQATTPSISRVWGAARSHRRTFALANDADVPRFLRLSQVIEMTGVGKTFIYTHMENGSFPKQIQISTRTVVWLEKDIIEWMKTKMHQHEE